MISRFKYCPWCKNLLETGQKEWFINCQTCGFLFYINPAPTVAAIICDSDKRLLLVERKYAPKIGYLDLPGGFINNGESLEKAIKREIKEELNCNLKEVKYFASTTSSYDYKGTNYQTLITLFTGKINKKIKPSDDVAAFQWFDKNEIPYEEIAFPELSMMIKKFFPS